MFESSFNKIFAVVKHIPKGRVATYGQVAKLAGLGRNPRCVGYALHRLAPANPLPWHRVINAAGKISRLPNHGAAQIQRRKLEDEGVVFNEKGQIDLSRFRWAPRWKAVD